MKGFAHLEAGTAKRAGVFPGPTGEQAGTRHVNGFSSGNDNSKTAMQIRTSGKNLDIGTAFQEHVDSRLHEIAEKYFNGVTSANVVVEKQRSQFTVEIVMHLTTGLVMQAKGAGDDVYAAFEQALERMEKRLRRYKRKLKSHVKKRRKEPLARRAAPSFVVAPEPEQAADVAVAEPETEETAEEELNPTVVAETEEQIVEMTAGEAVMQLELQERPFLIFRNVAHGGINVVYRRDDGHVAWIDPGPCVQK